MLLTNNPTDIITDKSQLAQIFVSGFKSEQKIGVESEKLLVYKDSNKAVKYEDVVKILSQFDENKWQRYYENEYLLGLKSDIGSISLEPGSQVELSLSPFEKLEDITKNLNEFYTNLETYAGKTGAKVIHYGIQPISTFDDIQVIPKKRYEYMTKYLITKGLTPYVMMRETAGIQANFDYENEQDAIRKLSLAIKMSPIISAVYANSPIRSGKLTQYKSFRANSWINVDEDRCGYIDKKIFDNNYQFTFNDYIEVLLDVPMIFIQRENHSIQTNQTFRQFMKEGFDGIKPILSDWENHISLYFTDVRLKSYVEIRNHDAQIPEITYSVPAFWKGIIYNKAAIEEAEKMLSKFNYEDFMQLRKASPVNTINAKIQNYRLLDLIREFFDISYASLKQNHSGEEAYLDGIYEYILSNKTPADDIITNYQNL